jgi:hypothetical protein
MRDLVPFKRMAEEVGGHMGLSDVKLAVIKAKTVVHKVNNGSLTLANLEPGRSAPTSKFFDVEYRLFREQLNAGISSRRIEIRNEVWRDETETLWMVV